MFAVIEAALHRSRTVMLTLLLILAAGSLTFIAIPKESEPDIQIPIVYVSMNHDGISPEDAERLLVRPMEQELRSIEGIKEMTSNASEGHASVTMEFNSGFDIDQALTDVREKVDTAKKDLPADTDEPTVNEVNVGEFPVLTVTLSGNINDRILIKTAESLKESIEGIQEVLEVDMAGSRDELLEVIVDPLALEAYEIDQQQLINAVNLNNQLVAAGALDTGAGRFSVKVPGLFENAEDVFSLPIKVNGDAVVTIRDVAEVRRTFKDASSYARMNGQPAIALEVKKRVGTNIIDTIEKVRATVDEHSANWPAGMEVTFTSDKSDDIRIMLSDLQNNVSSAVLLVMIVVIGAMGFRSGLLVGIAIPGSFLMGILILGMMGLTINMVVLFSLILAVGMLVDGAIVVTEFADRKMLEGLHRREAYALAAKRMVWPITASTLTTLAVFMPLLFWPDTTGEFMKYLPITLIATLSASLLMAIIFIPTLGALIGKPSAEASDATASLSAAEGGDIRALGGVTGIYARLLHKLVFSGWATMIVTLGAVGALVGTVMLYGVYGNGVEFFPEVDPDRANIKVHARGNLSVDEKRDIMLTVEDRMLDVPGIEAMYTRVGSGGNQDSEDIIGIINLEFTDWDTRKPSLEIIDDIRDLTADMAGIVVEASYESGGPPTGKDIQVEISSNDPTKIEPMVAQIRRWMDAQPEFRDVEDSRAMPGIEWEVDVDRAQAGRFGTNVATVGQMVQLVTNGIKIGSYRPDDADDEIDIRMRFPETDRTASQIDLLRVQTPQGLVPISNFVTRTPAPKTGTINRVDSRRQLTVQANVIQTETVNVAVMVEKTKEYIATLEIDPALTIAFRGADEDQQKSQTFLGNAFMVAMAIMFIILVTQFNSIYHALLILSAVILSTIGVLIGMMITGQVFSVVMTGIGIISLAGIVVNNNIVLIDTYQHLVSVGTERLDAIVRTGAQRLRPVMLTAVTTIIGLLPMTLQMNVDFIGRDISFGAPSTQWWVQLSSAVAFGLTFATILTLIVTPCLLALGPHIGGMFSKKPDTGPIHDELIAPAE